MKNIARCVATISGQGSELARSRVGRLCWPGADGIRRPLAPRQCLSRWLSNRRSSGQHDLGGSSRVGHALPGPQTRLDGAISSFWSFHGPGAVQNHEDAFVDAAVLLASRRRGGAPQPGSQIPRPPPLGRPTGWTSRRRGRSGRPSNPRVAVADEYMPYELVDSEFEHACKWYTEDRGDAGEKHKMRQTPAHFEEHPPEERMPLPPSSRIAARLPEFAHRTHRTSPAGAGQNITSSPACVGCKSAHDTLRVPFVSPFPEEAGPLWHEAGVPRENERDSHNEHPRHSGRFGCA